MSNTTARRALSFLIVGAMVLAGLFVLVTAAPVASARAIESPATPTTGVTGSPRIAENPSTAAISAESRDVWKTKLDSGLKDAVDRGSTGLVDVVIYTQDMNSLTPLLNKFAVERLPEEFRGKDQRLSERSLARSEGIVSTTVTIPTFAIKDFAKLPSVLGIETRMVPATADYTNLGLTSERESVTRFREQLQSPGSGPAPTDWSIVRSQHVVDSSGNYPMGFNGSGVNIAVQDWGADFGHPNLLGQWATDRNPASPYFGYPIMLSQESQWNNLQLFTTGSDLDRYPYPIFATVGTASWYSDTEYVAIADLSGNVTYATGFAYGFFQYTKRVAPSTPSCPGSNNLISRTYHVGAIPSASGVFHLGVDIDKFFEAYFCNRPGILVTDSITPGVYDTVHVDLNHDLDFTDDNPVSIAGNPLATWDANGDGIADISGGLLYFIGKRTNSIANEVVIASATGAETSASLANGWIETDAQGVNLFTATMALNGAYWPSSGEDLYELVIPNTTGGGNETGTTAQLTAGVNYMTGAAVDTAALLALGYPVKQVFAIDNSSGPLAAGVDYRLNSTTGVITWLKDFPDGDFVEIIYELRTWTLNYDSGAITFQTPPVANSQVTARYRTGLPVPYSNITAQRQGWDLFVPGPGDIVAFYGAFETFEDHGTWVSTDLAGVPFGNAGGIFDIYGTAPGAKIIGVDLPTSFDTAELFYFSSHGYDGIAGTGDEANIITNSWGFTQPQETGFTFLERYLYDLTTRVAPNVTILFAAGNNGPGYSTSTPPNTAPGVITVGAGTLMNYRWLLGSDLGNGWYDWPGFGTGPFGVGPYGDLADFSSKGPALMGTPEPDVFAAGAFGFGGRPLNSACAAFVGGCDGTGSFDLWSGTSMSTPVTAGIVALIYQAYKANGGAYPVSSVAKEILMSSADDHGFDVLQQGAGWVNATAAVELASSTAGLRVSPAFVAPGGYGGVHRPAFVNFMHPGDTYDQTFTVHNEGSSAATVSIGDALYSKVGSDFSFSWAFANPAGEFRILKPSGLYAADGHTLLPGTEDLTARWTSSDFFRITVVRDPATTTGTPVTLFELFDWWDQNGDGTFGGVLERNRYSFAGFEANRWSAMDEIYDPNSRVHDGLVLRLRDAGLVTGTISVVVEFYAKANWAWTNAEASTGLTVPADGSATFDVTFSVPTGTPPGMYQGAVWVASGGRPVIVPVLITVPATSLPVTFGGGTPSTSLYENGAVGQGQFPSNWRQTGDSRLYWLDTSVVPAANRRMIYNTILRDAPSEAEFFVYSLQPDAYWTDDATYGPGAMVELAATDNTAGTTNTNAIERTFMHTDVLPGLVALQTKALVSLATDEPLRVEVGTLTTDPQHVRISTNQLAGSVPVTASASVPLYDGAVLLGFLKLPGDGVLTHADPIVGSSTTSTPVEQVVLANPEDNTYFIAVHGWSVPAGSTTFDLTVTTTTASGTTVESFPAQTVFQDNPADPYTSSFVQTRVLSRVTKIQVDIAGVAPNDLDLYMMSDHPTLVLGGGNFVGRGGPTVDVPPNKGAQINLTWLFNGDKREGVTSDLVYLSPGFAPASLAQAVDITFSYDVTPPSFSSQLPTPGSTVSDSTPGTFVQINDDQPGAFAVHGEIDQTKIVVWLDGVEITSIASVSVPHSTNVGYPTGTVLFTPTHPLADGSHTMIVQAGDFAGNLATTAWSFTVDTTAPRLDISSPTPGLVTSAATVTVTGVTEPGATVSIGGSSVFVDGSGAFSAAVSLIEGTNTIPVSAIDALGNTASTSLTVVSDSTAPAISLLRSSAGLLTSKDLTVVSGVVSEASSLTVAGTAVMVHADGSFEAPVSLVEGSNSIAIVATDSAGNQGSASLTVTRDTTPPTLTMDALPSEVSSATVTVTGSVENSVSFVTVNGQPVTVSGGRYSASVALSFGSNVIFVQATDAAGNTATTSQAVSYVPQGVSTASVGLILLPVLTVIALLVGLAIGQARRGRGGGGGGGEGGMRMEDMKKEEGASADEELLPTEDGEL